MTEPGQPLTPPTRPPADPSTDAVVFDAQAVKPVSPSRYVRGGIVLGSAALFLVGVMAAMGASPTPTTAGASADPSASSAPAASATPSDAPDGTKSGRHDGFGFGGFPGFGFERGAFGRGGMTITGMDGSTLDLQTDDGWVRTITVTDATEITRAGTAIELTDLSVGDQIAFRQQRESDGSYTITAIALVLPSIAGQVTAVDGSTITVKRPDGTTATIHVSADTTYAIGDKTAAALSDVTVDTFIVATGTQRDDGSLDAEAIRGGAFGPREGNGGPGRHWPGGPDDPNAPKDDPNASPAPSATPG